MRQTLLPEICINFLILWLIQIHVKYFKIVNKNKITLCKLCISNNFIEYEYNNPCNIHFQNSRTGSNTVQDRL